MKTLFEEKSLNCLAIPSVFILRRYWLRLPEERLTLFLYHKAPIIVVKLRIFVGIIQQFSKFSVDPTLLSPQNSFRQTSQNL